MRGMNADEPVGFLLDLLLDVLASDFATAGVPQWQSSAEHIVAPCAGGSAKIGMKANNFFFPSDEPAPAHGVHPCVSPLYGNPHGPDDRCPTAAVRPSPPVVHVTRLDSEDVQISIKPGKDDNNKQFGLKLKYTVQITAVRIKITRVVDGSPCPQPACVMIIPASEMPAVPEQQYTIIVVTSNAVGNALVRAVPADERVDSEFRVVLAERLPELEPGAGLQTQVSSSSLSGSSAMEEVNSFHSSSSAASEKILPNNPSLSLSGSNHESKSEYVDRFSSGTRVRYPGTSSSPLSPSSSSSSSSSSPSMSSSSRRLRWLSSSASASSSSLEPGSRTAVGG